MGGHSVVVFHLHDDLATDPSLHYVITTILGDHILIPPRRTLESVELGGRTFGCHSPYLVRSDDGSSIATYVITTIFLEDGLIPA